MKVLFLDIDGVLVPFSAMGNTTKTGLNAFDPDCVAQLNRIVEETNCAIVLSSAWRSFGLMRNRNHAWAQGLRAPLRGITPGPEITGTERYFACRGDEIQAWLDMHPVESFCILDDQADMAHLRKYLVRTDLQDGLTYKEGDKVIEMLKKEK